MNQGSIEKGVSNAWGSKECFPQAMTVTQLQQVVNDSYRQSWRFTMHWSKLTLESRILTVPARKQNHAPLDRNVGGTR